MANPLTVYLQDHLAGSVQAVELVEFLRDQHQHDALGSACASGLATPAGLWLSIPKQSTLLPTYPFHLPSHAEILRFYMDEKIEAGHSLPPRSRLRSVPGFDIALYICIHRSRRKVLMFDVGPLFRSRLLSRTS
jgi:hypothetical protein